MDRVGRETSFGEVLVVERRGEKTKGKRKERNRKGYDQVGRAKRERGRNYLLMYRMNFEMR